MNTFRIVDQKDVTEQDFNDLPFWVDVEGELVWVSTQHHVIGSELYDTLVVQRVVNNVAQPVWQNYAPDNTFDLMCNLSDVVKYPKPIFFMSPSDIYMYRKIKQDAGKIIYKYRPCDCEVEQGEPCYCNIR